jgi:hypothetical protein
MIPLDQRLPVKGYGHGTQRGYALRFNIPVDRETLPLYRKAMDRSAFIRYKRHNLAEQKPHTTGDTRGISAPSGTKHGLGYDLPDMYDGTYKRPNYAP